MPFCRSCCCGDVARRTRLGYGIRPWVDASQKIVRPRRMPMPPIRTCPRCRHAPRCLMQPRGTGLPTPCRQTVPVPNTVSQSTRCLCASPVRRRLLPTGPAMRLWLPHPPRLVLCPGLQRHCQALRHHPRPPYQMRPPIPCRLCRSSHRRRPCYLGSLPPPHRPHRGRFRQAPLRRRCVAVVRM